jgi:histone-lysine N-methyltransferase SETMAR
MHMSAKSQAAIRQFGIQQLNHPPYSPDLAPSDYFLFRVMKKFLRGK